MFAIISYDVVDDRRRAQVHKLLKGYGTRVQYSVFECDLTQRQLGKIGSALRETIDQNTDSVRCYLLDETAVRRIQIVGIGVVTTTPTHYMVGGEPVKV